MSSDEFKAALLASTWIFRLLPILVLGTVGVLLRRRLRHPLAFAVLGPLIFFGVAWLVSQLTWNWRFGRTAFAPEDELAAAVLSSVLAQFAVTIALSIVPVVWLYRLLVREEACA